MVTHLKAIPIVLGLLALIDGSLNVARSDTEAEEVVKSDTWSFRISKVERVELSSRDLMDDPQRVAKWLVTTDLVNITRTAVLLLAVPAYGATITGRPEPDVFLNGSHLPVRSKDHDFVQVPPFGSLKAQHRVFAKRDNASGKFSVAGYFLKTQNVPEPLQSNNFPYEWALKPLINNDFQLSITLFDTHQAATREVLGRSYKSLWRGRVMTKHVKLSVIERPD